MSDLDVNKLQVSDTRTELTFGSKRYVIIGTAHVSRESVEEVAKVIDEVKPDKVCIELDAGRYASLTSEDSWKKLDIFKIIREGKSFLLLANLALASYQKKLGLDAGVKPGEEMKEAIRICQERNIPFALCDREISVTLRRAWKISKFSGKVKLLNALLGSAFGSGEQDEQIQVEDLKKKSTMQGMMDEIASYLPAVKQVLIDERDQFLATRMFEQSEDLIVAVVGAAHVPGITTWLENLHANKAKADTESILHVPQTSILVKSLGWLIPIAIVALIVVGFITGGKEKGLDHLLKWVVANGGLAALGTLLALGHPLTIVAAVIAAPIATLNPFIGVGLLTGLLEAILRKPRVQDLENLQTDIASVKGFYRNRVTRILLVFVLSSIGGLVGNLISLPFLFGST